MRGLGDARRGNTRHAPMVNGALAQQARAAFNGLADDVREGAGRAGSCVIGRSENRNGRYAQGGGDVHGARVVRQEHAAGGC